MRFNTTYTQTASLRETIEELVLLRTELINHINKNFKVLRVSVPLYLPEDSDLLINFENKTRAITFDESKEYKVNKMLLSTTNWMRDLSKRIDTKENEGIFSETQTILRDVQQKTSNTLTKEEITLQVRLPKNSDHEKFAKDFSYEMYDFIYSLIEKQAVKDNRKNAYPKEIKIFSSQNLEVEYPDIASKEKELNHIKNEDAFILSGAGRKKFSNKIHKSIHPGIYDLKNYYEFLFRDNVNTDVIKVATVSILASGQDLEDQMKYYNVGPLLEREFYANLATQDYKVMELKINVSKLAMVILRKGHIAEVQAGVHTKETNIMSTKHKVEII